MKFWLAIRRLLPVLAILGLVFAPFGAPAVAGGVSASMLAMTASDGSAMGDMDCCPPEQPVMPDCMKTCPLLALCLANTFAGISSAGAVLVRIGIAETFLPGNDVPPDTLAQGPPPRPPQA